MKVFIIKEGFERLAARRNLYTMQVAKGAKINPNTLYKIVNSGKDVPPEVRSKLLVFFSEAAWDDLFRLEATLKHGERRRVNA